MKRISRSLGLMALLGASACGGSSTTSTADPQNPPTTGRADMVAWLGQGLYKQWASEPAVHAARSPSPHGKNRIRSNAKLSAASGGEYPVDSAAVKELYDDAGTAVIGYAVYRKTKAGRTGDTFYWYESVPLASDVPHDSNGVVADGFGGSGTAQTICVGCHMAAGADANHSGHDFVYTQVR